MREPGRPKALFKPISVGGRPPVDVCLFPEAGDEVTPWLLEHDWIDEPVQRAFLDHVEPGMRVLDLGSHIGLFSLAAASLGASVVAVDAVALHVRQLRLAAERSALPVTALQGVAAARPGVAQFVESSIHSHVHTPESAKFETPDQRDRIVEVPALVVDAAVAAAGWDGVDVVKMDIEGTELGALAGMTALARSRPVFVFECNGTMLSIYGATTRRLRGWFTRRGYRLWMVDHLRPGVLVPADAHSVQPECVVDYLALPDERTPPARWRLEAPLSRDEVVTRLLDQAAIPAWGFRAYVSDVLRSAPAWLRRDPLIEPARIALAEDVDATVRLRTPLGSPSSPPSGDPPTDPGLVAIARDVAIAQRPEVLARAQGQRRRVAPPLVLERLSFHVRRGTFVGLLGVHPHERSVLLNALAGRVPLAGGSLSVRGRVLTLSRLAAGLEPELSVRENIAVFAAFLGRDARAATLHAPDTVRLAGLEAHLDDPLGDQAADSILRLALTLVLEEPRHDLVLLDGLPRTQDDGFADWAWERTLVLRRAGVAFLQAVPDGSALLGPPDRLLYLTGRTVLAAGHPGSVDDLFRRHTLGLEDRGVR